MAVIKQKDDAIKACESVNKMLEEVRAIDQIILSKKDLKISFVQEKVEKKPVGRGVRKPADEDEKGPVVTVPDSFAKKIRSVLENVRIYNAKEIKKLVDKYDIELSKDEQALMNGKEQKDQEKPENQEPADSVETDNEQKPTVESDVHAEGQQESNDSTSNTSQPSPEGQQLGMDEMVKKEDQVTMF